jgi:hypothetical protein
MAGSNRDPLTLCQHGHERPLTTVDAQRYRFYLRGAGMVFVLSLSEIFDFIECVSGP